MVRLSIRVKLRIIFKVRIRVMSSVRNRFRVSISVEEALMLEFAL